MKSQDSSSRSNFDQDANRDPLTGEPRSHPVGTGVGAAGGAAAGAAAGTAIAGPVGTVAGGVTGAVVGGVAGGAAGHAVAEKFNPTEGGDLHRFLDYTVVDRDNHKIGSIDAVWEDHTGQPAYVAVRTGWLGMGKAHVVPARFAQVNEDKRRLRLPFTKDEIKSAPSFDSNNEITEQDEFTISSHYGIEDRDERAASLARGTRLSAAAPVETEREELASEDARVRLKEEDVKVGKREFEYGGVRLRKIIRTETVNQPVELRREEIVIERTPTTEVAADAIEDADFTEEEIYIPLRREEAVVEKTVRAREEVRVGKRVEREQENISAQVRREDVEIDRDASLGRSEERSSSKDKPRY